jgi:hypothetical protein
MDVEADPWRAYNVVEGPATTEVDVQGQSGSGYVIVTSRGSLDKGSLLFRIEVGRAGFVEVRGALGSERA